MTDLSLGLPSLSTTSTRLPAAGSSLETSRQPADVTTEDAFRGFVLGTFYRQMLKSLHTLEGETAYLDGGPGQEIFQGQLDEKLVETLAAQTDNPLAANLSRAFMSGR